MPRKARIEPCLGSEWCSYCAKRLGINRFVVGPLCDEGWEAEKTRLNQFFIHMDGSPFIMIDPKAKNPHKKF